MTAIALDGFKYKVEEFKFDGKWSDKATTPWYCVQVELEFKIEKSGDEGEFSTELVRFGDGHWDTRFGSHIRHTVRGKMAGSDLLKVLKRTVISIIESENEFETAVACPA
jgi:hypothetical protein